MKSTGIVRPVDSLGRIVLPMELRRALDIKLGTPLEIYTEGGTIILSKYEPGCTFCGEVSGTESFKGKIVCAICAKELAGK